MPYRKENLKDYIINHGVNSSVDWSPGWSELQTEIDALHPLILLNMLTTSGHYIVATGYYDTQHTLISNDPYGNKNTTGYPSYDGTGAKYDWPGYNNGYQNLNTVHCFIYSQGTACISGPDISGHWTTANSPYELCGHVTVQQEDSLQIDPDVTINYNGYSLTVLGTLTWGTP